MSWQIDPDTGEEYWVEDEAAIDIPEPAPVDIPERPDDELRHTEAPINIKGYGKKMAVETGPGTGEYTNDYGEAVSPEYVQDIDQTIDQYGYDKIPDSKLGIPQKPSDDKLSQWEKWDKFYKQVKPQIESEATSRAEEAKSRVNNSFYGMMANSDISLMKPSQHAEISSKAAAAYNSTFQHTLDKETSLAQTAFTRELERSERERIQKEAIDRRKQDTGWKRVDGPDGYQMNVRVKDGVEEQTPSDIPNKRDITANKRTAQSKILKDVGNVLKASVDEGGSPVELDPGTLSMIQQRLEEAGLPPVKPKYEEPGKIGKMFGTEKKFKGYAFEDEGGTEKTTEKTVTIDGKQYKEGDEITRNGKRFRVRVK
jgi:hypothetical protein